MLRQLLKDSLLEKANICSKQTIHVPQKITADIYFIF